MKRKIEIAVICAAGWGRGEKFSLAMRRMDKAARGFVDFDKMTVNQFLRELDGQRINIRLQEEKNGEMVDIGWLGDDYNEAAIVDD